MYTFESDAYPDTVCPSCRSRFDIVGVAAVQKHYEDGWGAERIAVKAAAH